MDMFWHDNPCKHFEHMLQPCSSHRIDKELRESPILEERETTLA